MRSQMRASTQTSWYWGQIGGDNAISMVGWAKLWRGRTSLTDSWTQKIERYLLGKWGIDST